MLYTQYLSSNFSSYTDMTCTQVYTDYGFTADQASSLCTNSNVYNFTSIDDTSSALASLFANYDAYYTETYFNEIIDKAGITNESLYTIIYGETSQFYYRFRQDILTPLYTFYQANGVCFDNTINAQCSHR